MATTSKHSPIRPAVWTTWAPSVGILCVVGAHILAAALGLYSSAPSVTVLQPTGVINGQLEIAVRSEEVPTGSVDSASGGWVPLTLERDSMTYRGRYELSAVAGGNHSLHLRASDLAGHPRTVSVTVTVDSEEPPPSVAGADRQALANKGIPQG